MPLQDLEAEDEARRLAERSIVLIDVREPPEYAGERIPGALLFPLSTFDPKALPDPRDRTVVFHDWLGAVLVEAARVPVAP